MRSWDRRSIEEANLLNPAFLSVITHQCVRGYVDGTGSNAPYVLPFLVAPLILHKNTRDNLPSTIATKFPTWISQLTGTQAKAGYAQRASSIVPFMKEAMIISISNKIIIPTENNYFLTYNPKINIPSIVKDPFTHEVIDCFKKSHFCGRWFARAGSIETIMALLGVKP
ncbi:MAG: DUF6521 family protein [Methanoregula sp.]|nr:DUF6521 family protein [Methanoregula sp.]